MPEGSWYEQLTVPDTWQKLPIPLAWNRTVSPSSDTTNPIAYNAVPIGGTVAQGGYHVQEIVRWCLPDEDRASFYIDTGMINGQPVDAQDLSNCAIRIQVLDDANAPSGYDDFDDDELTWKTVFLGTCISQSSSIRPGNNSAARTTYYCSGILWRTCNWPLNRHSTDTVIHAAGHPGYNVPLHGWFRKVLGNKSTSATSTTGRDPFGDMTLIKAYYKDHSFPIDGAGSTNGKWTDEEAIRHALASSRAVGEPLIQTDLGIGFSGAFAWPVGPGETCYDLIRRICNRNRGRGAVFMTWTEESPYNGPIQPILRSIPTFPAQINYKIVKSFGDASMEASASLFGANDSRVYDPSTPDVIDVDLYGDHRVDGEIQYESRYSSVFDYLEIQGEPIQVLVNLNFYGGSLAKRWTSTDETAYKNLVKLSDRTTSRWNNVWRRYGIPPTSQTPGAWNYTVTGIPGGTATCINFVVDNLGTIKTSEATQNTVESYNSEMTVRVLPDLPIYEGWNYTSTVAVRYDGAFDYQPPPRMSPKILFRGDVNTNDGSPGWCDLSYAGFNFQVDDFGFLIVKGEEQQTGVRVLASTALAGSNYKSMDVPGINTSNDAGILTKLNIVCGIELGNRIRLVYPPYLSIDQTTGTVTAANASAMGRRLTMTVNGLHLWLGAPGCIWESDYIRAADNGYRAGLVFPGNKDTPYVIRDDRNDLSQIAALAWTYYGTVHNPCTWAMKDCGFLSSFETSSGETLKYPRLGQYVGNIYYSLDTVTGLGDAISVPAKTNITCIHYDHDRAVTTWRTDYVRYDGNVQ